VQGCMHTMSSSALTRLPVVGLHPPDGATFFSLVAGHFEVEAVVPPGADNISIHRLVPRTPPA
jgi:3-polyprenyl-4-hydroxybenzoate decarboxylase